jgi:hypothetical protein
MSLRASIATDGYVNDRNAELTRDHRVASLVVRDYRSFPASHQ